MYSALQTPFVRDQSRQVDHRLQWRRLHGQGTTGNRCLRYWGRWFKCRDWSLHFKRYAGYPHPPARPSNGRLPSLELWICVVLHRTPQQVNNAGKQHQSSVSSSWNRDSIMEASPSHHQQQRAIKKKPHKRRGKRDFSKTVQNESRRNPSSSTVCGVCTMADGRYRKSFYFILSLFSFPL